VGVELVECNFYCHKSLFLEYVLLENECLNARFLDSLIERVVFVELEKVVLLSGIVEFCDLVEMFVVVT